jgi:soluble P-type ATPase
VLAALRGLGIAKIYLVTGDHPDVAELVGDALGVDRVFSERTPADKVDVVRQARAAGAIAMVGDGVNDAPALALADVGIAMGSRGAAAAAESADVVLTVDRLHGLLVAIRIAKRTSRIARESAWAGMGLSIAAMVAAACGYLPPVAGAVLQEAIDVLVLLNALRALGDGPGDRPAPATASDLAAKLASEHRTLAPRVADLAALAGRLESLPPGEALVQLQAVGRLLAEDLLPHEDREQREAFPLLRQRLGAEDPTGPLIQTHQAIRRLARLYARLLSQLPSEGPGPQDLHELRRSLYGLHAVLVLHFGQEDGLYSVLDA